MSERKDRVMCSKLGEKGKREGGFGYFIQGNEN